MELIVANTFICAIGQFFYFTTKRIATIVWVAKMQQRDIREYEEYEYNHDPSHFISYEVYTAYKHCQEHGFPPGTIFVTPKLYDNDPLFPVPNSVPASNVVPAHKFAEKEPQFFTLPGAKKLKSYFKNFRSRNSLIKVIDDAIDRIHPKCNCINCSAKLWKALTDDRKRECSISFLEGFNANGISASSMVSRLVIECRVWYQLERAERKCVRKFNPMTSGVEHVRTSNKTHQKEMVSKVKSSFRSFRKSVEFIKVIGTELNKIYDRECITWSNLSESDKIECSDDLLKCLDSHGISATSVVAKVITEFRIWYYDEMAMSLEEDVIMGTFQSQWCV